jgi:hypothetical protein
MDLEDELFDVSYADINNEESARLLANWVLGHQNLISIGKGYTEATLDGWNTIAVEFDKISHKADQNYVRELVDKGFIQHRPHGPMFNESNLIRNSRSEEESKLVNATIVDAIELVGAVVNKTRSNGDLFGAAATQLPLWILNFSNMWQFGLGLPLNEIFVRELHWNMSRSMRISKDQVIEKISDYGCLSSDLTGLECLYFAYGSNMNKIQMASRTRSARLLGWADLPNFEYFIDSRGVASVRPRVGKSVKGLLWDIQFETDWEKLDRYEGVRSGVYKKLEIDILYRRRPVKSAVYISSTTETGVPRLGYQEGIISAVESELHAAKDFLDELEGSQLECGDDSFIFVLQNWENEMASWLKA